MPLPSCPLAACPLTASPPPHPTPPHPTPPHPTPPHFYLQGFLIPDFHKAYWVGLSSASLAPQADFKSMDPYAKPARNVYMHWGTMQPGNIREPNNRMGGENCATANYSQTFANAWGWSDTKCNERFPSICIVRRE